MRAEEALGAAISYINMTLLGGGAVVGKNVKISSIVPIGGGNRITFSYTLDDGTEQTSELDVMNGRDGANGIDGLDGLPGADGQDGTGIVSVEKIDSVGLVDTYRMMFSDGTYFDYEVKNGEQGIQGIPGQSGITPHIGADNHWFLGDEDTGVSASGTVEFSVDINTGHLLYSTSQID